MLQGSGGWTRTDSIATRLLGLLAGLWLLAGCTALGNPEDRPATAAKAPADDTRLAKRLHAEALSPDGWTSSQSLNTYTNLYSMSDQLSGYPSRVTSGDGTLSVTNTAGQLSAFHMLKNGQDALAARLKLAEQADQSIDLQVFEFLDQHATRLLVSRLFQAADRGVRVRLLVDDWGNGLDDAWLASLNMHPEISVRVFNPFPLRVLWRVNYVTHFSRVHRRMHNKVFLADSRVAVVGGRNAGDAYFDGAGGYRFLDLDVMTVGPAVASLSEAFDLYWNHQLAVPVLRVSQQRTSETLASLRAYASTYSADDSLHDLSWSWPGDDFSWATGQVVVDHPDKILRSSRDTSGHLMPQLVGLLPEIRHEALFISPYLVPGFEGVKALVALQESGVDVSLLTNSLAANNMPIVHSGYAPYRSELLESGIALWEVQPAPWVNPEGAGLWSIVSDQQVTLHAKAWVFDRRYVFLGSVNMDPRSFVQNTEIGILIDSPQLATEILDWVQPLKRDIAWQVDLDDDGNKAWFDQSNGVPQDAAIAIATYDPETTLLQRLGIAFYSVLPIEFLL